MKLFGTTLQKLWLVILFIGMATTAFCANIKITGRVIDNEEKPIEFGTVRIGGSAIGTSTDLKGYYQLTVAQKDTIEVIFSCIGFRTVNRKLVDAKGDVTLNVKMFPDDVMLEAVEVTGFRNTVNGMQTFDAEAFRTSPDVSGGSVEAMMATMPGVNSSNELSSQYSVRGGSFDENAVYINGVEIYRPQLLRAGQQEGLSIINPDMVGNLKFSTGGFPARYADKMSSVLDITYRDPEAFEAGVSLSLMGGSLLIGSASNKFSQIHGIRLKKNNSLLSSLDTKGEYDPLYFDYQTNMSFKASDKLSFTVLGNISLNHYNFKPADRETSFGTLEDTKKFKVYFDGEEKDRFETYLASASATYRHNRAQTFQLGLSGFLTNELVSYDISGEYWLNQAGTSGDGGEAEGIGGEIGVGKYMEHARTRLRASVIQAALRGTTVVGINNISYGAVWQHETFRDRTSEWEWRDSAGFSLPTLPDGVHLISNLHSHQNVSNDRLSVYAEDALMWQTNTFYYSLSGGVRLSYASFNKEFLASPRINFTFAPLDHPRWNFRASAGMYYQSPFYKEFRRVETDEFGNSVVVLNRDLKSPRSIQVIGGVDYTFRAMNRPFKLTAEAYYKNLGNLVSYEYDNLKVTYSGENDSKGFVTGLDFKLFGQFVPGSDSWISFSLMKTQQTLGGVKVPLPTDQRYSLGLYFTDYFPKFPKLKFSLRGIFSDGLTMTPPGMGRDKSWFRAPAYKRVDIGLSYMIVGNATEDGSRPGGFLRHFKSLSVGVDLFNLFDIANVSSYYWVTDVNGLQYAVPNYLTRRQINVRLAATF